MHGVCAQPSVIGAVHGVCVLASVIDAVHGVCVLSNVMWRNKRVAAFLNCNVGGREKENALNFCAFAILHLSLCGFRLQIYLLY